MLGKYTVVGICACQTHSEYSKEIVLSICRGLESSENADYRVVLFNSYNSLYYNNKDAEGEASIFGLAQTDMIDVMIIVPESIENREAAEALISSMRSNNIPVICVGSHYENCISIVFEYEDAFEKIVRHVVEDHGCKTVNFIAGVKGNEVSDKREECFRRVLRENNIEPEDGRIDYGDFWDAPAVNAMERFLSSGLSMPEAVICANDSMAIAVCKYLKEHAFNVPNDIIVTGFDGIELEKYSTPRLTTAKPDIELLGVMTEKTIASLISGRPVERIVAIPYKTKFSQSCGCEAINLAVTNDKILEVHDMAKRSSWHEDHIFRYIAKATVCNDFDELADVMTEYSDYNFWCCLNKYFVEPGSCCNKYKQNFTDEMVLLVRKLGDKTEKSKAFKAEELLPDIESVFDRFNAIMLCPLNFHEVVFGYIATEIHQRHPFENTRRFLFNTNMILENFRQRNLLSIANSELDLMQMTDPMTGLYNRRGFYRNVRGLFKEKNTLESVVIFSVDMDDLKYINDTFGHKEGDRAIIAVSDALKKAVGNNSVMARFGGDEFTVLTLSGEPESYILSFSEKLESSLEDFNRRSEAPYKVHASIGSAVMEIGTYNDIDEHYKLADKEMYKNKMRYKASVKS